ncbi:MFS transporter [Arthrobacter sp. NEB 688]|uniref:MFS transporter n=1 Tax=Arthrobacter sp. NEB 688 TaxID=904039 RepID=UPI001565BE25|nr:MFS transporter [Arthrobacter sp. NEB 688]QKE83513.1 MFS transporter [Arthrobacter sp. NEB 688]
MTTTDHTAPPPTAPDRLLDRRYLPLVVGVVALVTLAAFENRAVQTVLPVVVRELDGWALFGASTGASLVTFTVGMALSGGWTDRFGPRPVLLAGIGVFGVAQVVSATAPTMALFVGGRALSGVAEALIDTALMVLVAQALPESLRAKVFASFAAAWILPSLLGPGFAGGVESLAGWRWVFAGPLLVVPFALWLVRPALRGEHPSPAAVADDGAGARLAASFALAVGLAVTTFSAPLLDAPDTRPAGLAAVLAGGLVVVLSAARALPRGTARLRAGVPAVVGLRMLTAAAFTGVGSVIPLMLVTTHHVSTAVAGVSLSVTGVLWALGSWLNSTAWAQARTSAAARIRTGGLLIALGSVGPLLLALDVVDLPVGMVGWAAAATGMGILSPVLSTELLALAPEAERGRASATQGLGSSTGVALQTALVGGVVAWFGPEMDGPRFAALMGVGALVALLVALGAGRVRPARGDAAPRPA